MPNLISTVLLADDQQKILGHLSEIRKILDVKLNFTLQQKRSMPKLSDGRRPFAEKSLNIAANDPRIVPPYADLAELKKTWPFTTQWGLWKWKRPAYRN